MAAKTTSLIRLQRVWGEIAKFIQEGFEAAGDFLIDNARRLLAILLVGCILLSIFSCLLIGGINAAWLGGERTPIPDPLSADQITETFGARQFYLQQTAQARQK